jgi:hypothetical protein
MREPIEIYQRASVASPRRQKECKKARFEHWLFFACLQTWIPFKLWLHSFWVPHLQATNFSTGLPKGKKPAEILDMFLNRRPTSWRDWVICTSTRFNSAALWRIRLNIDVSDVGGVILLNMCSKFHLRITKIDCVPLTNSVNKLAVHVLNPQHQEAFAFPLNAYMARKDSAHYTFEMSSMHVQHNLRLPHKERTNLRSMVWIYSNVKHSPSSWRHTCARNDSASQMFELSSPHHRNRLRLPRKLPEQASNRPFPQRPGIDDSKSIFVKC